MAFALSKSTRYELKRVLKQKGFTQKEAAEAAGMKPEDISRLLNGAPGVGADRGRELCELLGVPFRVDDSVDVDDRGYSSLPLYDRPVMKINHNHLIETIDLPDAWLPQSKNGAVGLVKMVGDSMAPTLNVGDLVAVEFGSGFVANGLYACKVKQTVMIGRIQQMFDKFKVMFDNPMYSELDCNHQEIPEDFEIIGRVRLSVKTY
jgi:transcriptional regulator with XRE-family HTH domain